MEEKLKRIYRCDYCRKIYQVKAWAVVHEKRCYNNPENDRPCFSCESLEKRKTTVWFEDQENKWSLFFCKESGEFLIPPISAHRGKCCVLDSDLVNVLMPKKCKIRKKNQEKLPW